MEEQIINEVRARQCLYNTRHNNYSRRDVQKNNWDEIAAKIGDAIDEAFFFAFVTSTKARIKFLTAAANQASIHDQYMIRAK